MEPLTLERLYNHMAEVIAEFDQAIQNQDDDQIRGVIAQLEQLVNGNDEVKLNENTENSTQEYDHVLHELLSKLKEREYTTSPDNNGNGDVIDVAHYITEVVGKKVFRTHDIRKELNDRNVLPADFERFYRAGLSDCQTRMSEIDDEKAEMKDYVKNLFGDERSDTALLYELAKVKQIRNPQRRKREVIRIFERIKANAISNQENETVEAINLLNVDDNLDPNTADDDQINVIETFITMLIEKCKNWQESLDKEQNNVKENRVLFDRELQKIIEEEKAINFDQEQKKQLVQQAEVEKQLRAWQIRASILENANIEEAIDEWNDRAKRLIAHKREVRIPCRQIGEEGQELIGSVSYLTIEPYEEYEEDAYVLNLNDYKKYLEISSFYENSGKRIELLLNSGLLPQDIVKRYKEIEEAEEESGKLFLMQYVAEAAEYVATYHGFTNVHEVKYSTYKTAGSTLKAMKPVKGDLPATTKVGNAIENVFRFIGLRKPETKRIDENGQEVKNTVGAILTGVTDALVVGGIATAVLTGPIGWATAASAYAVRGGVLIGNRIAAKRYYKKHKEEIDNNIPTLGHPSKDDREVARKDYYRQQGMNRFTSWVKAKADRVYKKRAKETEEKIAEERIRLSDQFIDRRVAEAASIAERNRDIAQQNLETRRANTKAAIMSSQFYNDVVRDPNVVDEGEALKRAALNGTVGFRDWIRVNPNAEGEPTQKYQTQNPEQYTTTQSLESFDRGGTVAATAVTREEKYTARQQRQDRINRVITAIGTGLARFGIEGFMTGFKRTQTEHQPSVDVRQKKTVQEPVFKTVEHHSIANRSLTNAKYSNDALSNLWLDPTGKHVFHTNYVKGSDPIVAFSIRSKHGDTVFEASMAMPGYGINTDNHVYTYTNADITNMTPVQAIDELRRQIPECVEDYCKAEGLVGATSEEIALHAIKNGDMFGQTPTMAGWEQLLPDGMIETTSEQVLDHVREVTKDVIIKKIKAKDITRHIFDPSLILNSVFTGLGAGIGLAGANTAHEAGKQTRREPRGSFEVRNRIISRIGELQNNNNPGGHDDVDR